MEAIRRAGPQEGFSSGVREEAVVLAAAERELHYRRHREAALRNRHGLHTGDGLPLARLKEIFDATNTDAEVKELFDKAYEIPERLGIEVKGRPLLWERGAETAPEDVASPTITTITPQQGDEDVSRTKSQSNASSGHKDTANLQNNTNKQGVISENGGNTARPLPSWARKRFPEKDIAELVRLSYAEYLQRNGRESENSRGGNVRFNAKKKNTGDRLHSQKEASTNRHLQC